MKNEFIHKFESLPSSLQREIMNYIEQLILKYRKNKKPAKKKEALNFSWENGLSGIKDQFTSVELQHRANEMR